MSRSCRPVMPRRGCGDDAPRAAPRAESTQRLRRKSNGKDLHQPRVALGGGRGGDVEEARGAEERRPRFAPGRGQQRATPRRQPCERRGNAPGETGGDVALVPGEGLVTAVAAERDRDVPARLLAIRNVGNAASSPSGSS